MKKMKKMLFMVVSVALLFCGCDKTSGEDTPETNRLFSVTAEIKYGEKDISCHLTRLGDSLWKSEISSPFEIEGVTLSLSEDIVITEYHGMTVANSKEELDVKIGGENKFKQLENSSVIMAHYNLDSDARGSIGIIGPTRIDYASLIPSVRYLTDLVGELLTQTLNED